MTQSRYRVGRTPKDYLLVNCAGGLYETELAMMGTVKTRTFVKVAALKKWVSTHTRHEGGQIPLRCVAGEDILNTSHVSRRAYTEMQGGAAC